MPRMGSQNGPLGAERVEPAPLYTLGHSQPQLRPPLPIAEVKAAVAQVSDRNWRCGVGASASALSSMRFNALYIS